MLLSDSARATTAAEARFRIDAPNSLPRRVSVVSLGASSDAVVCALADLPWTSARFHRGDDPTAAATLAGADLVVFIATAGDPVRTTLAAACLATRATMMAVVIDEGDRHLHRTLEQLRPHCVMVVATTSEDCIADVLSAMRA